MSKDGAEQSGTGNTLDRIVSARLTEYAALLRRDVMQHKKMFVRHLSNIDEYWDWIGLDIEGTEFGWYVLIGIVCEVR